MRCCMWRAVAFACWWSALRWPVACGTLRPQLYLSYLTLQPYCCPKQATTLGNFKKDRSNQQHKTSRNPCKAVLLLLTSSLHMQPHVPRVAGAKTHKEIAAVQQRLTVPLPCYALPSSATVMCCMRETTLLHTGRPSTVRAWGFVSNHAHKPQQAQHV